MNSNRMFVLLVVGLVCFGAYGLATVGRASSAPARPASVELDAAVVPSASASTESAPVAPPTPPEYHAGDYKLLLPQGSIVIPGVDGGTVRFHDGNEHPCSYGCVAMYNGALQTLQSKGVKVTTDVPAVLADVTACLHACQSSGGDKLFWPPVSK